LALSEEDVARLTAVARSRTEPASRVQRARTGGVPAIADPGRPKLDHLVLGFGQDLLIFGGLRSVPRRRPIEVVTRSATLGLCVSHAHSTGAFEGPFLAPAAM
jgi:hypothetical protein